MYMYINVSSADINHINFEKLAKDLKFVYLFSILYKLSCLASSSFGHSKRKFNFIFDAQLLYY